MKNKKIIWIIGLVLLIDIFSKLLVSKFMIENQSIKIIDNFFYLTYAHNTGVAFSFLSGNIPFIVGMTFIVIVLMIKYVYSKKLSEFEFVSYGLVIGGAIGNLIDRVVYGYVIDFIDIYIFGYDYPIFNIADSCIVVGIIIIFIISIKEESSDRNEISCRKTR